MAVYPIQLSVYNDRLILWNEGRLPEGFTVETLLTKHPSRPYNKKIAEVFFKAGFIEAWGRGIAKIINGFIYAGFPEPVFDATMGGIMVSLPRRADDRNNMAEEINEELKRVFHVIIKNRGIKAKTIAHNIGRPKKTVDNYLKKLKQPGKIRYSGSKKTGGYFSVN